MNCYNQASLKVVTNFGTKNIRHNRRDSSSSIFPVSTQKVSGYYYFYFYYYLCTDAN